VKCWYDNGWSLNGTRKDFFVSTGKKVKIPSCPTCNTNVPGQDPFSTGGVVFDRAKQEIANKIVGKDFNHQEEEREREFWSHRDVDLSETYDDKVPPSPKQASKTSEGVATAAPAEKNKIPKSKDDDLTFRLVPGQNNDEKALPLLQKPFLRTSGKLKIYQVKKYLIKKLDVQNVSPQDIKIMCGDEMIGDEHSLVFLTKTLWVGKTDDLTLHYWLKSDDER